MADVKSRTSMARLAPGWRRGLAAAGVVGALLAVMLPASADAPETGADASVTLTVTPSDFVGSGSTVTVTGAGFPANTSGTIRQCGGSAAAPECDLAVAGTFTTTATGAIPPTAVVAKRILDTGSTTFNCGAQFCAFVATAGGRTSQHHVRMAGAGTLVDSSTPSSTPSSTSGGGGTIPPTTVGLPPPPTTVVVVPPPPPPVPTTLSVPNFGFASVCQILRAALAPFPFLTSLLSSLLAAFGCPSTG